MPKNAIKTETVANGDPISRGHGQNIPLCLSLADFEQKSGSMLSRPMGPPYAAVFLQIADIRRLIAVAGLAKADEFIDYIKKALQQAFSSPLEISCPFSLGSFLLLAPHDDSLPKRLQDLRALIKSAAPFRYLKLKCGLYPIKANEDLPVHKIFERAEHCCKSVLKDKRRHLAVFDHETAHELELRHHIREYFLEAMGSGELSIALQPIVATSDGNVDYCEALARWNDKKYGYIPPRLFVDVLEKSGMIHKLDLFTAKKACSLAAHIFERSGKWPHFSVNLSRLDFEACDIEAELESILKETGVPTSSVCIEITETMLSNDEKRFKKILCAFKEKGHELWIDDFGSGFSSFNVLKDYDFDVIKLDLRFFERFLTNVKSSKIIASVIRMAKDLGVKALAEGIEIQECVEFLKKEKCDLIQGFFVSKPLPSSGISDIFMGTSTPLSVIKAQALLKA